MNIFVLALREGGVGSFFFLPVTLDEHVRLGFEGIGGEKLC